MEYSNQELLRITDGDKCCHKNGFKNFRPRTTRISGPLLGTILPTRVHVVVSEDFFFFVTACRILVLGPEIESMHPALEAPSPNCWTTRKVPGDIFGWHNLGDAKGI